MCQGRPALCIGPCARRVAVTSEAKLGEGGGAFSFLRAFDHEGLAASLSWVLIVGYVLTMSVSAFTFGHYLGQVLGLPSLAVRVAAVPSWLRWSS